MSCAVAWNADTASARPVISDEAIFFIVTFVYRLAGPAADIEFDICSARGPGFRTSRRPLRKACVWIGMENCKARVKDGIETKWS